MTSPEPDRMRAVVQESMGETSNLLDRLVRIPSVSADAAYHDDVLGCAQITVAALADLGMAVDTLEVDGAPPAILATLEGPPEGPTVLLYAHYDVQPPGNESGWDSAPFVPQIRAGRLYGRGSADDKGAVALHAAAVQVWDGSPPVGIKILVEGEEEIGSPHIDALFEHYGDLFDADIAIIADAYNYTVGTPGLTRSLRGFVDCLIEVTTATHAVHSGMYGGAVPDALTALCRTLASLHDNRGDVAVPGLVSGAFPNLAINADTVRRAAGVLDGVRVIGSGNLTERMWTKPAASVLGIDAPSTAQVANKLIPLARAMIGIRLAPGDDAQRAHARLIAHLQDNVPWGAQLRILSSILGEPFETPVDSPAHRAMLKAMAAAWGREPVEVGSGGSIPIVSALAGRFPGMHQVITAIADPTSNPHSENESLDLADFEDACVAEALALSYFAECGEGGGAT